MLANKLKRHLDEEDESCTAAKQNTNSMNPSVVHPGSSEFFFPTLWQQFYQLEVQLNQKLDTISPLPTKISHIYNPVEYAGQLHCLYLQKYMGNNTKNVIIVGMNPGPNGMCQTGVPFGNVNTVQKLMQLQADVCEPFNQHPKRKIVGLDCHLEEPSGERIWNLLHKLSGGDLQVFAQQCYVHNICPLAFFDANGKNITPSEVKVCIFCNL